MFFNLYRIPRSWSEGYGRSVHASAVVLYRTWSYYHACARSIGRISLHLVWFVWSVRVSAWWSIGCAWSLHTPQPIDMYHLGQEDHGLSHVWNVVPPLLLSLLLCLPSDNVQHELQRWSLINISIPRKKKTTRNQRKRNPMHKALLILLIMFRSQVNANPLRTPKAEIEGWTFPRQRL